MEKTKEYKYPKNWFKHNLTAVATGWAGGNCSACLFRATPKYCEKMTCSYIDKDYMESVYWIGKETHANIGTWTELNKFFTNTPKQRIRDISNDIITKAVLSKKEACH